MQSFFSDIASHIKKSGRYTSLHTLLFAALICFTGCKKEKIDTIPNKLLYQQYYQQNVDSMRHILYMDSIRKVSLINDSLYHLHIDSISHMIDNYVGVYKVTGETYNWYFGAAPDNFAYFTDTLIHVYRSGDTSIIFGSTLVPLISSNSPQLYFFSNYAPPFNHYINIRISTATDSLFLDGQGGSAGGGTGLYLSGIKVH